MPQFDHFERYSGVIIMNILGNCAQITSTQNFNLTVIYVSLNSYIWLKMIA